MASLRNAHAPKGNRRTSRQVPRGVGLEDQKSEESTLWSTLHFGMSKLETTRVWIWLLAPVAKAITKDQINAEGDRSPAGG